MFPSQDFNIMFEDWVQHEPELESTWPHRHFEVLSHICNGLKLSDRECDFLLEQLNGMNIPDLLIPHNARALRKAELRAVAGVGYKVKTCPIDPPRVPGAMNHVMVERRQYELIHYDVVKVCEALLGYVEHR
jgi:hypothetical protein